MKGETSDGARKAKRVTAPGSTRAPSWNAWFQGTATVIDVPIWLSTPILTPAAGSLTPWFGSSS